MYTDVLLTHLSNSQSMGFVNKKLFELTWFSRVAQQGEEETSCVREYKLLHVNEHKNHSLLPSPSCLFMEVKPKGTYVEQVLYSDLKQRS